jgi:hypothetical protein
MSSRILLWEMNPPDVAKHKRKKKNNKARHQNLVNPNSSHSESEYMDREVSLVAECSSSVDDSSDSESSDMMLLLQRIQSSAKLGTDLCTLILLSSIVFIVSFKSRLTKASISIGLKKSSLYPNSSHSESEYMDREVSLVAECSSSVDDSSDSECVYYSAEESHVTELVPKESDSSDTETDDDTDSINKTDDEITSSLNSKRAPSKKQKRKKRIKMKVNKDDFFNTFTV